ncbi:MAG: chromosomal replication initiator protein DnaA [Ureaplasma sp.]|nr:chromosomal replication initiator protein DnaA [Ureaplasma sp.]MDE7221838.1 chromosomal replication initiator protein DnaA [Ureaplasma sp.]
MSEFNNSVNWDNFIDYYCKQNNTNLLFNNEILKKTKLVDSDTNNFVVLVEQNNHIELMEQYQDNLIIAFSQLFGIVPKFKFVDEWKKQDNKKTNIIIINDEVDPNINFSNYVVGNFNKNAIRLAKEVLKTSTSTYNPIFIYSKTGLGKTHLLSAVANEYKIKWTNKKLRYVNAQTFLKELYIIFEEKNNNSLKIEEFKNIYSEYDILLIDDIQYLANKSKTNEILFTIFNNLTNKKKIIILSSDRSPNELNGFEDRLISRFSSGITCKINEPEDDSLKLIINNTLGDKHINLTDDAISLVTNTFNKDIRELIGVLNKIAFLNSNLENKDTLLDLKEVQEVLEIDSTVIGYNKKITALRPSTIIDVVAKIYNIKSSDIIENSRKKNIATARHICMYIMREYGKFQLKDIGYAIGNRDHTTVLNGVEKIKSIILEDKEFNSLINSIIKKISI